MARLLVVSRSMALAMRIADDHDVVEYPAERLEELAPGQDVDVVVLDLGEPSAAMQALDRLRERGFPTPVLLVSGYQPAWKDLADLSIDRVAVVPLPITRAALLHGVNRVLGRAPASGQPPPAGTPSPAPAPSAVPAPPAGTASSQGGPGSAPERKRSGLSRFLSGSSGSRAGGSATDPGQVQPAVRNGSPLAAPTGPMARQEPEQDLFRPVVEPQVPVRSPSPRPRTPASEASPASTPPRPVPATPPTAISAPPSAPARSEAPSRTPVPSTPPSATATPSAPPAALPARPLAPTEAAERFAPLGGRPTSPAPGASPPLRQGSPTPAPERPPGSARPEPAPAAPPSASAPAAPASPRARASFGSGRRRDSGQGRGGERHPGFTPAAGPGTAPPVQQRDEVQAAVRALLDRRDALFGVMETAQVLADEVVERGESDAAAVLVPDGVRWRVSGGVGLRPLERRLLLDTSHWLISEIAIGGRALLIEDSDIVRPRLAGAPLAAWRHLLAVPVPGMRAAVLLARGQEASRFTERDLSVVVPVVAEAGPLLAAAIEMRELARVLESLRDVDS
jgi:hypothetical protein